MMQVGPLESQESLSVEGSRRDSQRNGSERRWEKVYVDGSEDGGRGPWATENR